MAPLHLPVHTKQFPEYPIPEKFKDADDALRAKVYWHLEDLGLKGNEGYGARIEKELSMIRERHCADYFLIVSDLCEKVLERGGIVGPGRGSAPSSLVNYLLGITEINPMEFGLIPEKFFSYNLDMVPDIDIDVDPSGYAIAQEYLAGKYVKLDFLKLPQLCVSVLAESESLDDKETMDIFSSGDTTGVFQFEFEGTKEWLKEIKPDKFEHLVAINSLCRPGALGRLPMYSALRYGTFKDLPFIHDENTFSNLHNITDETYGMILYQEQLMEIVSKVASFSLMEQRRLCKSAGPNNPHQMIDGKLVNILENLREKFLAGGIANGYDEDLLKRFWNGFVCSDNAQYLLNKAHMVSYTLISYRCAYLKAHNPALFYNTLYPILECDEDRKALYDDALEHGLVYMKSTGNFYSIIEE